MTTDPETAAGAGAGEGVGAGTVEALQKGVIYNKGILLP